MCAVVDQSAVELSRTGPAHRKDPLPHTCISPVRLGPTCRPSHQATSLLSFSPDPHHQAPAGPERHQGHPGLHGMRSDPRPPSDRQVLLRLRPLGGKRGGAAFGGRWLLAECPCQGGKCGLWGSGNSHVQTYCRTETWGPYGPKETLMLGKIEGKRRSGQQR